jgi:hypothetical protein
MTTGAAIGSAHCGNGESRQAAAGSASGGATGGAVHDTGERAVFSARMFRMRTSRRSGARRTTGTNATEAERVGRAPSNVGVTGLTAAIALSAVIWIVAGSLRSNWTWGLNAFGHLPPPLMVGLASLAVLGFVPAIARRAGGVMERVGEAWLRRPVLYDFVACGIVAGLLFVLRDPVRFVGDSDLRLRLITSGLPSTRLFQQAFPLDLFVNAIVPRALLAAGLPAEAALQIVGALVGTLYTGIALAAIRASGARGAALPGCAAVLAGGGYLLALPGYDKFGPLMVGIALAALGVVKLSRSAGGAWALAAGAAVCALSHRTGYAIALPAMLAFGVVLRNAAYRGRARLLAPAMVAGLACVVMLPRTIDLFVHFDLAVQRAASLSGTGSGATTPRAMLVRFSDTINALFFLMPLWPVGAVAAGRLLADGRSRSRAPGFGLAGVVAIAVLLQLAVMLATRGQQGAARDWDIHTGAGATIALCTALILARLAGTNPSRSLWVPLLATSLAIAVSSWSGTMIEGLQLRRIETFLSARPQWNAEQRARALDLLGWRAFGAGRFEDAAGSFERAIAAAPNPRYFYQAGLARWREGDLDAARRLEREAAGRAPDKADPLWVLSAVAQAEGNDVAAAAWADSARARGSAQPPPGLR